MIDKAFISELRGLALGDVRDCDACGTKHKIAEMEPEEAGMWICFSCWDKWYPEEAERLKAMGK